MGLQLFVQISEPYTLNSHTAFNPPRIIEESLSYIFLLGSRESGVFGLHETNIQPENKRLEEDPFLLGFGL